MLRILLNLSIAAKVVSLLVLTVVLFLSVILLRFLPMVEQETFSDRKKGLMYIVEVSYSLLAEYEQRARLGEFSREEAQVQVMARIRQMRYGDNDYLWINDATLPFPKMIMHPTKPELDGKILDDPLFACATSMEFGVNGRAQDIPGRDKNLFQAFVEVVAQTGDGFVAYDWPRPTKDGVTPELYVKQSYVRLFQPWGWVIGTGVYVDDITAQTARMRMTVIRVTSMILAAIMLVAFFFIASMLRPMKALMGYAEKVTQGDLDFETPGQFYGETGQLKQAITTMVGRLKQTIRDMEIKGREVEHAASELQKSNKRYDQLARQSRTMTWEVDAGGLYTHVGNVAVELIGYLPRELVGKMHFYDLYPREGREAFKLAAMEIFQQREPLVDLDNVLVHKDGHIVWVSTNGYPELNSDGTLSGYRGSDIDITNRKQVEEALRESEEMQRKLLQTVPDLIIRTDMEGMITFVNEMAFPGLENVPETSILGRNIFSVVAEHDRPRAMDNALARLEKSIGPQEYQLNIDDGIVIDAEVNGAVVRDRDAKAVGMVYVIRDTSERKRAEQERGKLEAQLLQAQKMESVGILAGGVAHDFNNLLQTMRGNIELLAASQPLSLKSANRLKTVTGSMDRAARLVQQLLFFSRKSGSSRVRVDLNQEVEGIAQMLERTISRMITLELQLDPSIWPVFADPVQIEQILLNLTNNAVDAMPEDGRLVLETGNVVLDAGFVRLHPGSAVGPHVVLSVTDTGHGMDRVVLDHVFDPFFTTKEVGKGTGLGLASVYGIVKSHGGYIQCSSEPGLGTTFRIYLPAMEQGDMAAVEPRPEAPSQGGSEAILVVDDEPEIRELTQEALEVLGYTVQTATTGEEALAIYREHGQTIDLVLLDLNMPGMGGYRCLQELIKLDATARVVIASGYTANVQGRDALSSGARDFISKPYRLQELAAVVRNILDGEDAGP